MYWYWIHVYNHGQVLGSFYTQDSKRWLIEKEINEKYGEGKWTRYTCE